MGDQEHDTEVVDEGSYLRIVVRGQRAFARCVRLVERVRDEARTRRHRHVLVDESVFTSANTNMDRFLLGEMVAREWQGLRVAVIDPIEAADEFAQTTATNRGASVIVVNDEARALEWLRGA